MTDNTILSRRKGLNISDSNGSTVLMDATSGKYYNLGEVGGRIWALLEKPTDLASLIGKLTAEYDVTAERCRADITPFLTQLVQRGLLVQH